MFPVIQIGPLSFPAPAMILLAGAWIGITLAEKYAARFEVDPNRLYNLVLTALVAGLVGARLAYIARFPSAFGGVLSYLSPNPELFDLSGGLLAMGLGALVYGQRRQMPFWRTLDALTPALAVFVVALGFSHLASGAAFGSPTNLPWGIFLWGETRHPAQVYEILLAGAVALAIWPRKEIVPPPGVLFLKFLALSAAAILVVEAFRGDSLLVLGHVHLAQLLAWVVMAFSLWQLGRKMRLPASVREV